MCGRFTLRTPLPVLIKHFQLGLAAQRQLPLLEPRYNIAPTQDILAIRKDAATSERTADRLRWGLVPSCAKELQSGAPLINARAETIAEMPAFRSALRKRRCLIPASGFFEWRKLPSGRRAPYWIGMKEKEPFALAGSRRSLPTRKPASCRIASLS